MELELTKFMYYCFGSAIILLLIFISVLVGFFIRYIKDEDSEDF